MNAAAQERVEEAFCAGSRKPKQKPGNGSGHGAGSAEPSNLETMRASLLADLAAGAKEIDEAMPPEFIVHGRLPVGGANLAGAGGAGKTTATLNEYVHIIGGGQLYGADVLRQGPCVLVTAEDGANYPRYLLRRVLEDGFNAGAITSRIAEAAKANIKVVGWTRSKFGPIATTDREGAIYRAKAFDVLLEVLAPLKAVYVSLDPAALFSPGERFGNDGEAFLAAMMHEAGLQLGACFQVLDHVSQAIAQSGTVHQHAARGATAKTDNARLARQIVKYRAGESDDSGKPVVITQEDIEAGRVLQLHWTKSNYAALPPFAWLRRRGYWIEHLRAVSAEEMQAARRAEFARQLDADVLAVLTTIQAGRYSKKELEDMGVIDRNGQRLSRARLRAALATAQMRGSVTTEPLPEGERHGGRKEYLRAAV